MVHKSMRILRQSILAVKLRRITLKCVLDSRVEKLQYMLVKSRSIQDRIQSQRQPSSQNEGSQQSQQKMQTHGI